MLYSISTTRTRQLNPDPKILITLVRRYQTELVEHLKNQAF